MKSYHIDDIAKRIKSFRNSLNMTQEQFAEACCLDIRTFQRAESGRYLISTESLISICKTFNVSSDFLLFGELPNTQNIYLKNTSDTLNRSVRYSEFLLDFLTSLEKDIKINQSIYFE